MSNVHFYDESYFTLDMARTHGYAPVGERVIDDKPKSPRKGVMVMACLNVVSGIVAEDAEFGSVNASRMIDYAKGALRKILGKGKYLVLDNASPHHDDAFVKTIEATGTTVLFLPPYSPDYNPIENAWSKVKAIVRELRPRTRKAMIAALKFALDAVSPRDAQGWTANAGYVY